MDSIAETKTLHARSIINGDELADLVIPVPYYVEMNNYSRIAKRVLDLLFSGLLLIFIFSWLYPFMLVLIKLTSKGPVFFVQKRIGKNEKIFNCYKFRTMYLNDLADIKGATENDERITFVGKWLRKLYIDELPQLINIFKGDMSVVGPRPHMVLHHKKFSSSIPYYNKRHLVKPGLTGLAQIKGYHGSVEDYYQINGRTKLDLFYIKKISVWLDIKILISTFFITCRLNKFI